MADTSRSVCGRVGSGGKANHGAPRPALFAWLQRQYPGKFQDGQLRTFQRGVRRWRATQGPAKEVYFSQVHEPGRLCASDFTEMKSLEVRIGGQSFEHLVYHFVLTYSNWEWAMVCYSESFESLSEGLQSAVRALDGVPARHRTDRLSAAVNNLTESREFTERYRGLTAHYGLEPEKIQPRQAHENGDVESSHRHFKEAVDQALMLRGSREFESREAYTTFLVELLRHRNTGRQSVRSQEAVPKVTAVTVAEVDLSCFDQLLEDKDVWNGESQGSENDVAGAVEGVAFASVS